MTPRSFAGADPVALNGLAELAEQYTVRLGLVRAALTRLTDGRGPDSELMRILSATGLELGRASTNLKWRAAVIESAQRMGIPVFSGSTLQTQQITEFATLGVFSLGQWEEAFEEWRTSPSADELRLMNPEQAHARFAALSPSLGESVAVRFPQVVGRLDGAPPQLRYLANSLLLRYEVQQLQEQIGEIGAVDDEHPLRTLAITALRTQLTEYRRWLAEDRQILLFDPDGDGRAVEVFGDLNTATHVGVVIPGMANSLANFSEDDAGFRSNAIKLFGSAGSPSVATIAWLGYDTPDGADASVRKAAETGVEDLRRFLEGIDPVGDRELTVIAHSYGSVLSGLAASEGLETNNLVFVGSPGTTLDGAEDARLRPGGQVWAALADRDPIVLGVSPAELPTSWPIVLDPTGLGRHLVRTLGHPEDLWHGTNPAHERFDALRITTDGCSGHSDYFEAGALRNLGSIVAGRYSEVDFVR